MNNDIDNTEPDWLQVSKLKDLVVKLESTISTLGKELNACRKQLAQYQSDDQLPPDPTGMQYPVWKGPYVPPTQCPTIVTPIVIEPLDYLAGQALTGLLQTKIRDMESENQWPWLISDEGAIVWNHFQSAAETLANFSYEIAEAMLKRSKQIQQGE